MQIHAFSTDNDASLAPLLAPLYDFLPCKTPKAWLDNAINQLDLLLIDHAHCEKKAASTALSLLYRYPEKIPLLDKLSKLAREELLHFEKVISLLDQRNIAYRHLSPCRYAGELFKLARKAEPGRLVDTLIIGAIIEARSCERFASLLPLLDLELAQFYRSLLRSEARHFSDYLTLAKQFSDEDISERVKVFLTKEKGLILSPDSEFRFHSGPL